MASKRVRVMVTLPPDLVARLDETCERIHVPKPNRSAAVEEAVALWLDLEATGGDRAEIRRALTNLFLHWAEADVSALLREWRAELGWPEAAGRQQIRARAAVTPGQRVTVSGCGDADGTYRVAERVESSGEVLLVPEEDAP